MLTPRRLIALLLALSTVVASLAQTAPAADAGGEKLTLNDAIQRALAKNFSIKVQGYDAAIAAAGVTTELGKFDPVLNGNYTYSSDTAPSLIDPSTGLREPAGVVESASTGLNLDGLLPWGMTYQLGATNTNTRGTFNSYANNYSTFGGVSGTQPLLRNFGFGPTLASIRIAQANRSISQWQFRQTVIDTITGVSFAYAELSFAYAARHSAISSRQLALDLLAENEKRFKVGNVSEYDVTSARSRVASREESILFAEQGVHQAENALKQLISDDQTTGLLKQHVVIEPLPPAPIVVVDPAIDFHTALEKRPDYQQAQLALKRDDVSTRLARNQLLPRVDLVGSYGYNGYDTSFDVSRRQIQDRTYNAYSWGVVVSVPLTFTAERGRYRAARMQREASATQLQQVEQNIVVLVGNAADAIDTAQKRLQATRQARELAQATLDAEVKRLRAGSSSTFFVAQQQEILSGAEVNEARAQADCHEALANYDRQLGVTLEKLNVKIDPPK